jgi:tRNA-2-methylthio-N6-dimethylallyladenosine synthase
MNVSDSERVITNLGSSGYDIVSTPEEADVVLINTCSVREKAEHKLYTRVGEIGGSKIEYRPIIGVLGCVSQLEGETLFEKASSIDFVVGTRAVGRIGNLIEEVKSGNRKVLDLGEREEEYDWTVAEKSRQTPYVAFVPIIEGCNKFCTYCIVPFSRGREKSLPASQIVSKVLELKNQGVREIHLIGQNVNSYRPRSLEGLEKFAGATPFSRLLRAVAATGIERIKFTTSFPRDFHTDIVKAINENENLCNWVHLPVQSGSDRILRLMRRGHTSADYLRRVEAIRDSPRNISLTTDVIVGFPGETEEDFQETVKLFEKCHFDSVYMFKYSSRSGTPAAQMKDEVSFNVTRDRFIALDALQKRLQEVKFRGYIGRTVEVLAENFSAKKVSDLTGHSTCHKVVNFTAPSSCLGKIVKINIKEHKINSLFGELV